MFPLSMQMIAIGAGCLVVAGIVLLLFIRGNRRQAQLGVLAAATARAAGGAAADASRYRLLTLSAVVLLMVAVSLTMYFVHGVIGLDLAYWIVPVFGALGGLVGSLIRNMNHLSMVSFNADSNRLHLGFVGDVILGLGGAAVVTFLFESTLRFDPDRKESYPLMISVCFLAGVFGQLLIMKAGKEWLAQEALDVAKETKKKTEKLEASAASAYVIASLYKYDHGLYEEALKAAEEALKLDSNDVAAIIAKARALKRLGDVQGAMNVVNAALGRPRPPIEDEDRGALLYNKACYTLLLNAAAVDETLRLLEEAFPLNQIAKAAARGDDDLRGIWGNQRFQQLTA